MTMAKTRKTYEHPAWLKIGVTAYMVTASKEPEPCTVLDNPTKTRGTVRVRPFGSGLPWTTSTDRIFRTESEAWTVLARQLERRAAILRNDAADVEGQALAAHRRARFSEHNHDRANR
jgi:hypothetical protein